MADDDSATQYHRLQLILGLASLGLAAAYLAGVLATGAASVLAAEAARVISRWWWRVAVVSIALGLTYSVLTLPLAWLRGYWLPRRFGLLHQSAASWLGDRIKAVAVSGLLGLGAVEVIYALLRVTDLWWLAGAAIFFIAYAALAAIVPIWLLPLFYRLTPLEDQTLTRRVLALAERVGVPALGVWVADQSRKGRTANAALAGLGRTRRIILFDTLLAEFTPEEIEAVLAHELAHHVHGDVRRGLIVQGALTLLIFWLADVLLRAGAAFWRLPGLADPAGIPWLALTLGTLGLLFTPLTNTFSRWLERQADDFALVVTGNPAAFIAAMERLGRLNLAERRPHRFKEIVLYSHPALERRILRARRETA